MDKRVIHQKLLMNIEKKADKTKLKYIDKPDPEPVKSCLFKLTHIFSRSKA